MFFSSIPWTHAVFKIFRKLVCLYFFPNCAQNHATSTPSDNEKLLGQNEERRKEIESTEAPDICSEKETMNKEPNPRLESDTSSVGDNHDLDNIDPKICKGLEKIKKLDAILSEKIKVSM